MKICSSRPHLETVFMYHNPSKYAIESFLINIIGSWWNKSEKIIVGHDLMMEDPISDVRKRVSSFIIWNHE